MAKSKFLPGVIFGAAIAAVATLLYTPKTGEEVRRIIKDEVDTYKEDKEAYKTKLTEKGAEYLELASAKTEDITVSLKHQAEVYKKQLEDLTSEATSKLSKYAFGAEEKVEELQHDLDNSEVLTEFKEALKDSSDTTMAEAMQDAIEEIEDNV